MKAIGIPPEQPVVYGIVDPDYARVFSMARCLAWSEGQDS